VSLIEVLTPFRTYEFIVQRAAGFSEFELDGTTLTGRAIWHTGMARADRAMRRS
jgi:hypothetical protein